jgi:hypothetical protein
VLDAVGSRTRLAMIGLGEHNRVSGYRAGTPWSGSGRHSLPSAEVSARTCTASQPVTCPLE